MKTRRAAKRARPLRRRAEDGQFTVFVGFLRAKHSQRLTPLQRCVFLWLCSERGLNGYVCNGAPVPASMIARDLGCSERHVCEAREALARWKYIRLVETTKRRAPIVRVFTPPRLRSLEESEPENPDAAQSSKIGTHKRLAPTDHTNCSFPRAEKKRSEHTKGSFRSDRISCTVQRSTAVPDVLDHSDQTTTAQIAAASLDDSDAQPLVLTSPAPTARLPRKTTSEVTRLRERFAAKHAATMRAPYHAEPARDGRLFKRLLSTYTNPAYVAELLDCFWQQVERARAGDSEAWIGKATPTVAGFYKQVPNILKRFDLEAPPALDMHERKKGESNVHE